MVTGKKKEHIEQKASVGGVDLIADYMGSVGGLVTVAMVILVTLNVVTRALASWLVPGLFDLIAVMGAVFYSCGVAYAAVKGRHVSMKFVVVRLPKGLQRICGSVVRLIILLFCALFVYAGAVFGWEQWMIGEKTDDLGIPVGPFRFAIVVALVILFVLVVKGREVAKDEEAEV